MMWLNRFRLHVFQVRRGYWALRFPLPTLLSMWAYRDLVHTSFTWQAHETHWRYDCVTRDPAKIQDVLDSLGKTPRFISVQDQNDYGRALLVLRLQGEDK